MTAAEQSQRTLAHIAKEILTDREGRLPMRAGAHVEAMAQLPRFEDDEGYKVVAKVRSSLGSWRSPLAPQIKLELEVLLAHYRADRW